MNKKVALVLSGCGVFDGSEIHESVIALNALEELSASITFFAPNIEQMHAINHLKGVEHSVNRNVLEESARLARGNISDLASFDAGDFDALVFVGGFGAAKNLSTFAIEGENCSVNADVALAINKMLELNKASAFICISPVIAARVIANGVELTIGNDEATAQKIEAMGAKHINCEADSFVHDAKFNVYSTPAYMLAQNTVELRKGISTMFSAMLS
ncbi:MAG: isoprenoid biosynthesis glyoxalase ElbB [Opitutales bacterium]